MPLRSLSLAPLPPCHRDTILTLPLPNAIFIWYCAWLSIPSAIYAYSHPATAHLAAIPASVWLTSLLYWRNPVRNSWRRTLDMAVVFSGATYQTYYAFRHIRHTPAIVGYSALIGCSAALYRLSQYFMTCGRLWPATYAHASIHLVANVANIVLYDSITTSVEYRKEI